MCSGSHPPTHLNTPFFSYLLIPNIVVELVIHHIKTWNRYLYSPRRVMLMANLYLKKCSWLLFLSLNFEGILKINFMERYQRGLTPLLNHAGVFFSARSLISHQEEKIGKCHSSIPAGLCHGMQAEVGLSTPTKPNKSVPSGCCGMETLLGATCNHSIKNK